MLVGAEDGLGGMVQVVREAKVVQALVDMADTLVDDYDVVDVLTGLADRCVELLGAAAAGVMLASNDGELRVVASSSEAMRVVELFELQEQEGPCLECFSTGARVAHVDLGAVSGRWPSFAKVAIAAGFRSAHALPLRLRGVTVGALNLFNTDEVPMAESDVAVAQAFADLATISILQHRAANEAQLVNQQLSTALSSRIAIEQAKGMVAERSGVDMHEAFSLLRTYARNNNLRLTDVAQSAIDGTLDGAAFAAAPAGRRPRR